MALGADGFPQVADAPRQLKRMPTFAGDVLDPAQTHGDLLLHITGTSARAVSDATGRTLRALPQWDVRWRLDGHRPENHTEQGRGLARNPFHFAEGYGNPDTPTETTERATIKAGQGEPVWAVGGQLPGHTDHPPRHQLLGPGHGPSAGAHHRPP
jgi:deferrochelatase/peroxidase EfeB